MCMLYHHCPLLLFLLFLLWSIDGYHSEAIPDYEAHPETDVFLIDDVVTDVGRNAVPRDTQMWPRGVVPYVIDSKYPQVVKDKILAGMREIELDVNSPGSLDCIRFEPRTNEHNYIYILARGHRCYSSVGRTNKGRQDVSIGKGCEHRSRIMHELTHALGFNHEQSRPDRDSYVRIDWKNIKPNHESNFNKHPLDRTLNTPYDYGSLMHYGPWDFARDPNRPVLTPKRRVPDGVKVGQRLQLSELDVLKIQRLYNCTENTSHVKHRPASSKDGCDFAKDFCLFTQGKSDHFDWVIQNGSSGSGPQSGLTTGKDSYAIARAPIGRGSIQAWLYSPWYTSTTLCLEFSFFFTGKGSHLKLYTKHANGRSFLHVSYSAQSKRKWYPVIRRISKPEHVKFKIIFEAVTVQGDDVAIDDVVIYQGDCI